MNGYFDYEDYDFTHDYPCTSVAVAAAESQAIATCDRCRLLPGEAVNVGGRVVVCACWMGQGASEGMCQCGPGERDVDGGGIPD
ncbi:hypothetical protein [Streptomyces olivaceiscleroticus]|uniref:Uncharacterized protein n=1 Tax=Streptomyces olivaceiscleroticus TaxID=68245 RepID=A0ABN1BF81_9ACTN